MWGKGRIETYSSRKECHHLVRNLLIREFARLDNSRQDVVFGQITGLLKISLLLCNDVAADVAQVTAYHVENPILLQRQEADQPFRNHKVQTEKHEPSDLGSQQLEEGVRNGVFLGSERLEITTHGCRPDDVEGQATSTEQSVSHGQVETNTGRLTLTIH